MIEHHQRVKEKILKSMDESVSAFVCDPYFEELAGIPGISGRDKEQNARKHLGAIAKWDDLPTGLQELMLAVKSHAVPDTEVKKMAS